MKISFSKLTLSFLIVGWSERIVIMFLRLRGNHTRPSQDEFGKR